MILELRDIVGRYKTLTAGQFGGVVALRDFGWRPAELEGVFSALDEDYHISRYFHFSDQRASTAEAAFSVNDFPQTHLSIDKEVEEIL